MKVRVIRYDDGSKESIPYNYKSFNIGSIFFVKDSQSAEDKFEYLNFSKKNILENKESLVKLFNELIDNFDDKTDEFTFYRIHECFWWEGFYYLYKLLNEVFTNRGIHSKLKFIDNNPNFKLRDHHSNYKGFPYMLSIPFYEPTKEDVNFEARIIDKHFLCLNRRIKPFREQIVEMIHENNLLDKFHYSFGVDGVSNKHPFFNSIDGLVLTGFNPITGYEKSTFCMLVTENQIENRFKTHDDYVNSQIHIRDGLFIHLTEKTTRAITLGIPFIMISSPYSLKVLKECGFKTFGDFWDESYDNIKDWNTRYKMIENIVLQLSNYSIEKCNEIYKEMIPILKHNRNRYLELNKHWESNMKEDDNLLEYKLDNEDEYYKLFKKMKFKQ